MHAYNIDYSENIEILITEYFTLIRMIQFYISSLMIR